MDYDELLESLLECTIYEEPQTLQINTKSESPIDMIIDEPIIKKQVFKFNCIEDNETYYPDIVARRRYGGYKPPKARAVKFIDPFAKKIDQPAYSKQLHDSMSRIELRKADKKDTKIKYLKKKGYI